MVYLITALVLVAIAALIHFKLKPKKEKEPEAIEGSFEESAEVKEHEPEPELDTSFPPEEHKRKREESLAKTIVGFTLFALKHGGYTEEGSRQMLEEWFLETTPKKFQKRELKEAYIQVQRLKALKLPEDFVLNTIREGYTP